MRAGRVLRPTAPHWGAVDQALSSGTNFALLLLTVRSVDVREFGAFSLAYLLYVLSVPLARATGTVPFTIRHLDGDPGRLSTATASAVNYALALGVALGLCCLAAAGFVDAPLRSSLLVLGFCFPLLLVQDAVRGVMFARLQFMSAIRNDAFWTVVQFMVLCPLLLTHAHVPVSVFIGAWGLGGALAGAYGYHQLAVRPRIENPLRWLREQSDLARPLFAAAALTVLPAQLTYLLMPTVSSLAELGAVRAAYVLFGPMNVAFTTASMLALPYAVRLPPDQVRAFALKVSLALAALSGGWALAVASLPDVVGRALIGDVWSETSLVRLLLSVSLVAEGVIVGPVTALSALGIPDRLARVRYVTAPLTLVAGLGLAHLWGARGVALALAASYSLTSLLAWSRVPTGVPRDP